MAHNEYLVNGTESTKRVREEWSNVRALMLVIHATHEVWEKALLTYDEEYMEQACFPSLHCDDFPLW